MRDPALVRLGWRTSLAASIPPATRPARILARDRGRVVLDDGTGPRSVPLTQAVAHAVSGDWVALDAPGAVRAVLTRRGVLERPGHGPVAANVDLVLVTHAVAEDPALARLPRFLSAAAAAGCDAVVLVTKADLLAAGTGEAVAAVRTAVAGAVPVLPVAAQRAADGGLDAVRALVGPGVTAALVGASGAGKSTLVNALLGEARQATGAVRAEDGRGRHVTVRRELVPVPGGGLVLDSPGVRLVPVAAETTAGYGDVAALAARCRFTDCRHGDEPGCAVRAAIDAGDLAPERLAAVRRLDREAEALRRRADPLARRERKALSGRITREQRRRRRERGDDRG